MYIVHWHSECIVTGLLTTIMHCNWPQFNVGNTASVQWSLCFDEVFMSQHVRSVYHNLKLEHILLKLLLLQGSFFSKWSRAFIELSEFSKFRQSENHWNMNWAQFKAPVSHMCLAGAVVASWFLTQEVAGSSPFNDKHFSHWI